MHLLAAYALECECPLMLVGLVVGARVRKLHKGIYRDVERKDLSLCTRRCDSVTIFGFF